MDRSSPIQAKRPVFWDRDRTGPDRSISTSNVFGSLPFKLNILRNPFIDLKKNYARFDPKYVSLYLSTDNYKPFFLNQKIKKICIEYIKCNCYKTCFICKN